MKKIFIAGATGRVALSLIQILSNRGYQVIAGARNPEKIVKTKRVSSVYLELHDAVEDIAKHLQGVDAVYFVAGSRGKDLLQTDAFGAVKLMQAAEHVGVKRFLLLSSIFADKPKKWADPALVALTDYNIAKFFADEWLKRNTKLDYTIVQPGSLQEMPGSGKINTHINEKSVPNAIENVAQVLADSLEIAHTIGKVITMSDGETPIREALSNY